MMPGWAWMLVGVVVGAGTVYGLAAWIIWATLKSPGRNK